MKAGCRSPAQPGAAALGEAVVPAEAAWVLHVRLRGPVMRCCHCLSDTWPCKLGTGDVAVTRTGSAQPLLGQSLAI